MEEELSQIHTLTAVEVATAPDPVAPAGALQLPDDESCKKVRELALRQLNRFMACEARVLKGDDAEAIHDMRVASRRLHHMFGAWLKQPDRTWFFKLMGDDTLVSAQHDAFTSFLKSVVIAAAPVVAGPVQAQSTNDLPKGNTPPFAPFAGGATPDTVAAPVAGSGSAALTWTTPTGWRAKPLGEMRLGSFTAGNSQGEADISVIAFPGDAGGLVANLNRWRGQVGLAPLAESDVAGATTAFDAANGLHFTVVNFSGQKDSVPARLLGAIVPFGGQTYFFKMIGPDALVAAQHDAFISFLKSVVSAAGPAPAQSTGNPPENSSPPFAPLAGGATPDTGAASTGSAPLIWIAPTRWQAKPLGSMRLGSFSVGGSEGAADISIIAFPGEVGGLQANLNRWRGQVGLAPLDESGMARATTSLDGAGGLHFTIVDFAGQAEGAPARLLGAVAPFAGQTYFFKMTGPDALVAREKPAFLDFLKTVKSP